MTGDLAFKRLKTILEQRLKDLTAFESTSTDQYDSPSWSHRQAHLNGMRHELQKTLQLFDFMDKGIS